MVSGAESGSKFGVHPDNRVPLDRVNRLTSLLGVDIEARIREGFKATFGIEGFDINPAAHAGSQATYFAEFDGKNDDHKYYASALAPYEITSDAHYHEWPQDQVKPAEVLGSRVDMAEEYYILEGEAVLTLGEGETAEDYVLNKDLPSVVVHAGTLHRLRTEGQPALLILKTRYGALVSPDRLHQRPEKA